MAGQNPNLAIRIAANLDELKRNIGEGKNSIEALGPSVAKMAATWTAKSAAIIQNAQNITAAVQQVGAGTLSAADAAKSVKALETAMAQLAANGKPIPPLMTSTADALRKVEEPASKVGGFLSDMGKHLVATAAGFVSAQAVLGAVSGAYRTLAGFVADSVKAYGEADAAQIKLTAALRAQHTATPTAIADLNAMASEFQRTTVHGDDTINMMQTLLVEIGGVMPYAMKGALEAATNLSAGLGIDLDAATRLVAKAAAGHTEQLGKYGIVVDQAALKTQGFDAVLAAINRQFGGQAAAELETYAGKVKQIGNDWNNFQEAVGKFVLTNPFTIAALRELRDAAAELDEKSGEASFTVAGLWRTFGLPVDPAIIGFLASVTAESNNAHDALDRFARLQSSMKPSASHITQDEVEQRKLAAATLATKLAAEAHAKAMAAAKVAAEQLRKELPLNTEAVQKLEAGFYGLHTAVGLADDSEQDAIVQFLAGRKAIDAIERSAWLASFGVKGMADGLDKIGEHNNDIVDLSRSLQRMVDIERTMPAGFYQTGVALDSLGRKSTEIDELRIKLGTAKTATNDWSGALSGVADLFMRMSQTGGEAFSKTNRQIGMALQAATAMVSAIDKMSAATATTGDQLQGAADIAGVVYTLIIEIANVINEANEAARKLKQSSDMSKEWSTTVQFSQALMDALDASGQNAWLVNLENLSKIIQELGGFANLSAAQVHKLWEEFEDLIKWGAGGGSAWSKKLVKEMDDILLDIAQTAVEAGGIVSNFYLAMVTKAQAAGIVLKGVNAFTLEQAAAATAGFAVAMTITATAAKERIRILAEMTTATGADLAKLQKELQKQDDLLAVVGIHSQQAAEAVGASLFSIVDAQMKAGKSFRDALLAIVPIVQDFQAELVRTGFKGGEGFEFLLKMVTLVTDEIAGPALNAIHGYVQGLVGMANINMISPKIFAGIALQVSDTVAELVARGFDKSDIMAAMGGDLQKLWELQRQFGYTLDAKTQKLVDDAVAAGLVGVDHMTIAGQSLVQLQRHTELLSYIAGLAGGIDTPGKGKEDLGGQSDADRERIKALPAKPQAFGGDYLVTRPTLFLAGDAGPERATFTPQRGGASGGGTTVIVTKTYLDGRQIAEALTKVAA